MPSVVICDDHRVFGQALVAVLQTRGYEVLACTSDPDAGVAAVARHQPDVYVVDLYFPGCTSLASLGTVPAVSPRTRTVILSGSCDPQASADARRVGAGGFIPKDGRIEEILAGIQDVVQGRSVFPESDRARRLARSSPVGRSEPLAQCLTPREREVLGRLVQGLDTGSVARSMGITYSTARTHIQSLLTKLGVHSKLEAVALVTSDRRSVYVHERLLEGGAGPRCAHQAEGKGVA